MKKIFTLIVLLGLLITGCRKDQSFSSFETNVLLPLAGTELDFNNLLRDSILVPDANGALHLVSTYDLYRAKISDLLHVPDTERVNTLSLKTLRLADQNQSQMVPLFLIYPDAMSLNGQTVPVPAQSITGLNAIPVDASEFFKEATFNSGTMEISIANGYPVTISTLIFQLSNVIDGSVIQTDTFTNIQPGSSQTKIIDVAGKTLYAQMEAKPLLIETAASPGPVYINALAYTTISFAVKDLRPFSAIARFPAQSVLSEDLSVVYYFGEAQLKKLRIKSGSVSFNVVNTIEEDMKVDYRIPYATRNGQPFVQTFTVPAAPPGGSSNFRIEYPIAGYEIDLRGKNPVLQDTVNSFYNVLDVTIDSSGIERRISLDDSIYLYIGLIDLVPDYAEGYFGQNVFESGVQNIEVDFLKNLNGGIDFEYLNFNVRLENGIGAPARANLLNMTGRNTKKGSSVSLNGTGIMGIHDLNPAIFPPLQPYNKIININSSNSNIKPLVEQVPNQMDYNVSITTNPNGNVNNFRDFITDQSEIAAVLEVDMPMSFKADKITLLDTMGFDLNAATASRNVLRGHINFVVDNGFPFEVDVQFYLLDENGNLMDSLVGTTDNKALAAPTDVNNKVISPQRSVVIAKLDEPRLANLRRCKQIVVKASIDTPKSNSNYWRIYNDYRLKVSVTGDFIYEQNNSYDFTCFIGYSSGLG